MELTPVSSCSVTSTQEQFTVPVEDGAELPRSTRSWSLRRALLWLTLVILVATCCNALIPVIRGGPLKQAEHETASEFQSLLSKDWPPMDVKQDLDSVNHRVIPLVLPTQPVQHRMASDVPVKRSQKNSRKLPRRTKKHRHESTTFSSSTTPASSMTSSMGPTTSSAALSASIPTISPATAAASTTTTTPTTPTIFSLETASSTSTTSTTTSTTTARPQPPPPRNPAILGRARTPERNRLNHSKRNLIKLRSQCFPGFITIGTTGVSSNEFDKSTESEAFLEIISLNSTNGNKTVVALRGDKSGHYLCLQRRRGFVSRKLRPNSIPRECRFIEKHQSGKYVRYVSFKGPRRFLSFDENGKAVPWRNHKRHRLHSKSCTNFLRVAPAKSSDVRKIIREHLLPEP
ncbi:uncharacterized serine-rich protein C215.13 [Galendromus occidentalis]|uniref:Uncharacterized serine-rich protein C215.13 n=1 Tax=Galendromus occidentalis TaxID=34638 RepID=A0AAJ7L4B9_9ACAR|nr:uncharacterized serine-rich protein C215.13 [Galendromus occidentalis]